MQKFAWHTLKLTAVICSTFFKVHCYSSCPYLKLNHVLKKAVCKDPFRQQQNQAAFAASNFQLEGNNTIPILQISFSDSRRSMVLRWSRNTNPCAKSHRRCRDIRETLGSWHSPAKARGRLSFEFDLSVQRSGAISVPAIK